ADAVVLEVAGVRDAVSLARYPDLVCVDSALGSVGLRPLPRFPEPAESVESGSLLAPMPAAVARVDVAEGAEVEAGQSLLVLEAMKMQHVIRAPQAGVVRSVRVVVGEQVEAG